MGVTAFGQNRLYDEQGAVDLGNAAKRTGAKGVAGGGAAGAPIHAIQPHPARLLGRNGGQHPGLPAKGAVTGKLVSATKFAAARTLYNTDVFNLAYRVQLTSS